MTRHWREARKAKTPLSLPALTVSMIACPSLTFASNLDEGAQASAPSGSEACENQIPACFVLSGIIIEGATVFAPGDFTALYQDYLTKQVSARDLSKIADAITAKYRAAGYFLSRAAIGEQNTSSGVARVTVYEGKISSVVIEGSGASQVRSILKDLAASGPLKLKDLDARLAMAAAIPGIKLKSQIEPYINDPAAHKLVVRATLQKFNASFYIDNRGVETSGPAQSYTRIAINSAIMNGDQAGLALFAIPSAPKEFTFAEASYAAPMQKGAKLWLSIAASKSQDGANAATAKLGSESSAFTLRYAYPLSMTRNKSIWAEAAFEARRAEQDWPDGGQYRDDLRIVRATLRGFQRLETSSIEASAEISAGLNGMGASKYSIGRHSRDDADGGFTKLRLHGALYKDIGPNLGLYAAADAQYSANPLLASEEFQGGGLPYGRAYAYGEISGDHGVAATLEMRAGYRPRLKGINFLQGYLFYDAARVWNFHSDGRSPMLSSAGFGLRITAAERYSIRLEAAKPLSLTPFEERDRDWRPFISFSANY